MILVAILVMVIVVMISAASGHTSSTKSAPSQLPVSMHLILLVLIFDLLIYVAINSLDRPTASSQFFFCLPSSYLYLCLACIFGLCFLFIDRSRWWTFLGGTLFVRFANNRRNWNLHPFRLGYSDLAEAERITGVCSTGSVTIEPLCSTGRVTAPCARRRGHPHLSLLAVSQAFLLARRNCRVSAGVLDRLWIVDPMASH